MFNARSIFSWFLSASLTFMVPPLEGCDRSAEKDVAASQAAAGQTAANQANTQAPAATYAKPTPDQLYQMVAPIALFPDNLVAQVLAGSTYPDQISNAATWLKQNASLKGDALMQAVDKEQWDVSVKALTQFPDVLNQMASNLSWTSALGDAYFNVPQDVMNAVQVMRQRASQAGNLKSTQQQKVSTESASAAPAPQAAAAQPATIVQAPPQTIVIQPAQPEVVYVPTYNPTVVYGAPVAVYPGYVVPPPPSTGELVATGLISFGVGMAVGAAIAHNSCCGWGWNSWGCGWHSSTVVYNHNTYISNSNTFVNRNNYYNRNVNNINRTNVNNVNRTNVNNVNRNNINNANVNRVNNNNYRANNFNNTTRNSNFTTPNFGSEHNQAQFKNANQNLGSTANRGDGAQNRGQLGQNDNRGQAGQNQNRPQAGQDRANPNQAQRGFGQQGQQDRGGNSGAFGNVSQGGNARVNSARGQQSLSGTRSAPRGGRRR
jgi:hypothetical protein